MFADKEFFVWVWPVYIIYNAFTTHILPILYFTFKFVGTATSVRMIPSLTAPPRTAQVRFLFNVAYVWISIFTFSYVLERASFSIKRYIMFTSLVLVTKQSGFTILLSNNFFADCSSGYFGVKCFQSCRFPNYGPGCQRKCNCTERNCNHIKGCLMNGGKGLHSHYIYCKWTNTENLSLYFHYLCHFHE